MATAFPCVLKGVEDRILVELLFLDQRIDADNVLLQNPSSTNAEMSRKRIR